MAFLQFICEMALPIAFLAIASTFALVQFIKLFWPARQSKIVRARKLGKRLFRSIANSRKVTSDIQRFNVRKYR
jgi:hypothetical protein